MRERLEENVAETDHIRRKVCDRKQNGEKSRKGTNMKKKLAILFDIDDTLYDQVVPFEKALKKIFPGLTGVSSEDLFQRRSYHGEISFRKVLNQEMTQEEMYRYRVQKPLAEFGVTVSDEEAMAFQEAYEQSQRELELSETMEQLLNRCQESGVLLGIITNGPAKHQRHKADILGMNRWIPAEYTIVSGEVGIVKPDLRIFRLAEERMNLSGHEIWYVGDSFPNDMLGARTAGWRTIWLNRRRKALPKTEEEGGWQPDYEIHTDEELQAVMDKILQ